MTPTDFYFRVGIRITRDTIVLAFKYATKRELLGLYLVLFVGLSLLNWNIFAPLFGVVAGVSRPVAVFFRGVFGFLTAIVGFVVTVVSFVGVVKFVVEDTLDGHRFDEMGAEPEATADTSETTGNGEEASGDVSQDGQAAEAN